MSNEFVAGHLDIQSFAKAGAVLSDQHPVFNFERLTDAVGGLGSERKIAWQARGELRQGPDGSTQNWLHLTAQAVFPMTCQRCLGPAELTVAIHRSFRFVATEAQAEAEDDAADEDVLVLERRFDLLGLIEDEFLMALPVIPRHETCPAEVKLVAQDPDFDSAAGKQPSPFAVLAKLQTGKTS